MPLSADALNELDGFSPMVQILMHIPSGVDLEASDASRLLDPECCGQPPGPPWIDTRTHTDRSLRYWTGIAATRCGRRLRGEGEQRSKR